MKRSKFIDLNRMRKSKAGLFALAPLAMAVMAGCSDSAQAEKELAQINLEGCKDQDNISVAECEAAYRNALRKASQQEMPRFNNMAECQQYYGECRRPDDGSSVIVPLMAGYIAAEMIDELGDAYESSYYRKNHYRSYKHRNYPPSNTVVINNYGSNRSTTSSGSSTVTEPKKTQIKPTVKPKVIKTVTQSRSGFGSTAKAKSSWGGSSRSGGWGG